MTHWSCVVDGQLVYARTTGRGQQLVNRSALRTESMQSFRDRRGRRKLTDRRNARHGEIRVLRLQRKEPPTNARLRVAQVKQSQAIPISSVLQDMRHGGIGFTRSRREKRHSKVLQFWMSMCCSGARRCWVFYWATCLARRRRCDQTRATNASPSNARDDGSGALHPHAGSATDCRLRRTKRRSTTS